MRKIENRSRDQREIQGLYSLETELAGIQKININHSFQLEIRHFGIGIVEPQSGFLNKDEGQLGSEMKTVHISLVATNRWYYQESELSEVSLMVRYLNGNKERVIGKIDQQSVDKDIWKIDFELQVPRTDDTVELAIETSEDISELSPLGEYLLYPPLTSFI